jgi:uncharacterized membrane protein (DUF2068 family)
MTETKLAASPTAPPSHKKPLEQRAGHSLLVVRLIAIGKLFKSACLLIIGVVILHSIQRNTSLYDVLHDVVNAVRVDETNHFIHGILEKSLGVSEKTLRVLSVGTLIYAIIYGTEGIGLLFDKGWAEWMVIISTAGFIPLEFYELHEHLTIFRIIVFLLNIVILIYIAMRLRWRHLAKQHARATGATLIIPKETRPTGIKP